MINKLKYTLIALICIFISSNVFAQNTDQNIHMLVEISGLAKQTEEIPNIIKSQINGKLPDNIIASLKDSIDKTILPSAILTDMHHAINNNFNNEEISTLLKWYESDTAKRITAAEEKASTPEAYQEMMATVQKSLANTKRVATANRLDDLISGTSIGVKTYKIASLASYSVIKSLMQPEQPLMINEFKAQLDAMEPKIHAGIKQSNIVGLVYTYKDINNADLAQYEEFLGTPTGKKFSFVIMNAFNDAFEKTALEWAHATITKQK